MNPLLSLTAFIPFFAAAFWLAAVHGVPARSWGLGVAAGLLLWTLLEYVLHRFAHDVKIHVAGGTPHAGHHMRPTDLKVMVTPLSFTIPTAVLLWGALRLLLGGWAVAGVVMTGLLAGYFVYEFVHYSVHMRAGGGRLIERWRAYHLRHHFKTPHRCFGVTSPLWDWIFRTSPAGGPR